jgi:RNA polymerase sigma-70 factor (ECF subfamily)
MKPRADETRPDDVVAYIPALRAFAWTLTRRHQEVDDLVQDTLLKAIAKRQSYTAGTNMRAWLFTIMRNTFLTGAKKATRERTGDAECVSGRPSVPATQDWTVRGNEVWNAVMRLPGHYREALILVLLLGESYESTARICGIAIGTVKSRVNRARCLVMESLGEAIHPPPAPKLALTRPAEATRAPPPE